MRAGGGCALQQALTPDAAAVIKQAVLLAKRRGHAQVTPLHVANTMLAATNGLFRVACLDSHSHPLQCKALDLCFNVALNRLPATSNSHHPMLSPASTTPHHQLYSHQYPSISNALVAAFKRAQAHQRRGSIENHHHPPPPPQQQSILAVKIELEQLIISILDDPSVSRVMREAGFSSTQVKTNVERAVSSLESYSKTPPPPPPITSTTTNSPDNDNNTNQAPAATRNNEDINTVIETLLARRKSRKGSIVIVGESTSTLENTVKGVMDRVDRGSVPESLTEVKFITIPPLYSFCNLRREEVEQKIGELTCLVDSLVGKGVVLYIGDLKWISDYRVSLSDQDQMNNNSYYCSVEHVIMELGRLVWRRIINNNNNGENEKFWLMGIANFQTYMSCRNGGHSSLETVWGLHPLTLPANTLTFSLLSQSDEQIEARDRRTENRSTSSQFTNGEVTCCDDCSAKLEAEIRKVENDACKINVNPTLPSWLKDESARLSNNDQYEEAVREEIHKKWNKFCSSAHKQETLITTYLTRPASSSNPNSASSSDVMMEMEYCYTQRFKEFNAENLNIICNALEKKVPWQKEIIPEIAGTILQCRSGMLRRRRREDQLKVNADVCINKEETWLCFLGPDGGGGTRGKEEISRELARVVFGSYSSFVSVGLSSFASSEKCRNKRGRDEESCMSYMDRFARAVSENPHRVFLVEDLDQADYCSKMRIKRAIETGRLTGESGDDVGFFDAIIVLSCEGFSSRPTERQSTASRGVSLDLNLWSFDGDSTTVEDQSVVDDVGILENVDRRVVFKIQDL
ncbi:hypothetical protein ABFX02_12G159500 [Erythranthe guttata]